jgi:hypothetical protein
MKALAGSLPAASAFRRTAPGRGGPPSLCPLTTEPPLKEAATKEREAPAVQAPALGLAAWDDLHRTRGVWDQGRSAWESPPLREQRRRGGARRKGTG